jgi:hypothetical protein
MANGDAWTGSRAGLVQRYRGPDEISSLATGLAVDTQGNIIVIGNCTNTAGQWNYVTIKYSLAGTPLWTNHYHGPVESLDQPQAVAVDGSNNVFVTGWSAGAATVAYSVAGVALWTNNSPGANETTTCIEVGSSGNVYVGGYPDTAVAFSSNGLALWTNRYIGAGNGSLVAPAMAVDGSNNVIVAGYSNEGNLRSYDYTTIKYSSAGLPLWTNHYGQPCGCQDQARAIAVDGNGNVYVTGDSFFGNGYGYATVAYSNAGIPLWTNYYGPINGADHAVAVKVSAQGNVYVTGFAFFGGPGGSGEDYITIAYTDTGVPLWTNRYGGKYSDKPTAMAVDAKGNVYVTGSSSPGNNGLGYATVCYSGAGTALWTNIYYGVAVNSYPAAHGLAVAPDGSVIVTGTLDGGANSSSEIATIRYAVPPAITPPVIANTILVGTNLAFSGYGGTAGRTYYVETFTNLAGAGAGGVSVATNTFGSDGSFVVTTPIDPNSPVQFYRVRTD